MKQTTAIGIILLAGLFAISGQCEKTPEPRATAIRGAVYKDTVHLANALNDIQNYVDMCRDHFGDSVPIRSYSINKWDLFGVLGVTTVPDFEFDHCRVYLGLSDSNKFKLYMTPTRALPGTYRNSDTLYVDTIPYDPALRTYFVYDLNAPCPSTCDKKSKLYINGN